MRTRKPVEEIIRWIPRSQIIQGRNPRTHFNQAEMDELCASMRQHGFSISHPITVRRQGDNFEIVAGERRWRAAGIVNIENIACIVRNLTDEQAAVVAMTENLQRSDLSVMEEAMG